MNTQDHISQEYNEELEALRSKALTMGGLVEENFTGATKSLLKGKTQLAQHIAKEDYKVNALEVSLDEDCSSLIARRQPAAIDLRNIFAVLKIVTDLERIGDESEKIARFAAELDNDATSMKFYSSLKSLIISAREILSSALDCYARLDADKAMEVVQLDSGVDSEFMNLNRTLTTYLLEDIKNIEDTIKVMWCARSIERVGDHAKNICEYVVYVVHGNDIRHITDEEAE
ncbi:MAG: phosphate signaling complex protein PhoU [Proteobacteria bacterium]|nr:phosphate signaling complex protein PhoU [Pseudomonadota bacterium]MCH9712281.1 phosphate signaling complex protein PhoU [Pseudomonadota bacterium]MCH9749733.1 phosphate signaling complex protein PhoU [Pseudomonadota bacterium]